MKKILKQPTNHLIVGAVVFLTLYITAGNGLANTIISGDPQYIGVSLLTWIVQIICVCMIMFVLYGCVSIGKKVTDAVKNGKEKSYINAMEDGQEIKKNNSTPNLKKVKGKKVKG